MKTRLYTVFLFCILAFANSSAQQKIETGFLDRSVTVDGQSYRYQVYVPSSYTQERRWPVIMFLHGIGERGSDGIFPTQVGLGGTIRQNASRYPAIVVFPQVPNDSLWSGVPAQMAMAALEQTLREYLTDEDRVYLTGLSMGGNGTWYLAYRYTTKFAAVVPICGWISLNRPWLSRFESVVPGDTVTPYANLARKLGTLPVWIFHGEEDRTVPVEESRKAAAALKAVNPDARYTEFLGTGHNSWDAAYGSTSFIEWLFTQKRKN